MAAVPARRREQEHGDGAGEAGRGSRGPGSQALRRELVDTKIGVTYIAPRGIKTPMNNDNTVAMWAKTGNKMDDAETVAKIVVNALIAEKQEVFIGQPQTFFAWLNGVAPKLVNIGLKKQTGLAKHFLKN